MIRESINAADAFAKLSQPTGVSVDTLSTLAPITGMAATSMEAFSKGMARLSLAMNEADTGSKTHQAMFAQLGIAYTDTAGNLRGVDAGLWSRAFDLVLNNTQELCYEAVLSRRARTVCAEYGVECARLRLRIVRVRLSTGDYEYLVTSLCDAERYPLCLFSDLYARRWAVEEAFKQLKCRLTAENFSGKSVLAVEQDFHARVLLMNLTNLFVLEADRRIACDTAHREHRYQANRHFALAQLRRYLPRLLLGRAGIKLITKILQRLSSESEAVRPDRICPRDAKPLRRGYPVAYKPVA